MGQCLIFETEIEVLVCLSFELEKSCLTSKCSQLILISDNRKSFLQAEQTGTLGYQISKHGATLIGFD